MCIGYVKPFGRGKILHLGIEPSVDVIHGVLRYFKIPAYCRSLTPTVKTALFSRDGVYYLALVHNGDEDKTAVIGIAHLAKLKRKFAIRNLFSGNIEAQFDSSSPFVSLPVRRKDGCLYEIKPA